MPERNIFSIEVQSTFPRLNKESEFSEKEHCKVSLSIMNESKHGEREISVE